MDANFEEYTDLNDILANAFDDAKWFDSVVTEISANEVDVAQYVDASNNSPTIAAETISIPNAYPRLGRPPLPREERLQRSAERQRLVRNRRQNYMRMLEEDNAQQKLSLADLRSKLDHVYVNLFHIIRAHEGNEETDGFHESWVALKHFVDTYR